ncbi:MAG: PAS domain-containing protein [Thermoleophilia bacterium]
MGGRCPGRGVHSPQFAPAASPIVCLSPDRRITEFNPEAERLYGKRRNEVLGADYFQLFLPEPVRGEVAADM